MSSLFPLFFSFWLVVSLAFLAALDRIASFYRERLSPFFHRAKRSLIRFSLWNLCFPPPREAVRRIHLEEARMLFQFSISVGFVWQFDQISVTNFDNRSRALTGTCLIVGTNVLEIFSMSGRVLFVRSGGRSFDGWLGSLPSLLISSWATIVWFLDFLLYSFESFASKLW